ncbi:hypothetical protein DL768_003267 [Monosporascus sp. mg162]|nr:hypothetical protein DL768_003267 [Monosporascus sp. mg162]
MPQETPLAISYANSLRRKSKVRCGIGNGNEELPDVEARIQNHIQGRHADALEQKEFSWLVLEGRKGGQEASSRAGVPGEPERGQEKPSWPSRLRRSRKPGQARPRRLNAAELDELSILTFEGYRMQGGFVSQAEADPADGDSKKTTRLIKRPETRPISQEQLILDVKGIYAGLVMVESKCIEVDTAQSSQGDTKLNNEQWQALTALHRTLLHEHHDFFLASQHPSASPALRRLASKYAMPARMWRHGIHSFLELLRHRLPASLEHMITFIYLAYSMMALLYETVTASEDTWIECLGDLGRYRMAMGGDNIRDKEVWTSVSRLWYSKASDKAPTTGRLYHHLAILARPNTLQQSLYYERSFCTPRPFASARPGRESMAFFGPITKPTAQRPQLPHFSLGSIDAAFARVREILFSSQRDKDLKPTMDAIANMLDYQIPDLTQLMDAGYNIAIANGCSALSHGIGSMNLASLPPNEGQPDLGQIRVRANSTGDSDRLLTTGSRGGSILALLTRLNSQLLAWLGSALPIYALLGSVSASPIPETPDSDNGSKTTSDAPPLDITWAVLALSTLGATAFYSAVHKDFGNFLSLGMAVTNLGYLFEALVFQETEEAPSRMLTCAALVSGSFTFWWLLHDLRHSGLEERLQRLVLFCTVAVGLCLDLAVSSSIASSQAGPTFTGLVAKLIVPGVTSAAIFSKFLRTMAEVLFGMPGASEHQRRPEGPNVPGNGLR